jgi:hypothetical protein
MVGTFLGFAEHISSADLARLRHASILAKGTAVALPDFRLIHIFDRQSYQGK